MKFRFLHSTITFLMFSFMAVSAQSEKRFGFYTIKTSTKDLYFVDTLGNLMMIGPTYLPATTLNYHSMDFDKSGNLWFLYGDKLYLINKENGKAQPTKYVSGLDETGGAYLGLSFNSKNKPFIHYEVSSIPPGTIYITDNLINCNAVPLPNSTGVASILGIEFDDNDNLWAFDECCVRKLHQIDTITGKAKPNSFSPHNLNSAPADLDFSNNILYGLSFGSTTTKFFRANRNTGVTREIFSLNGIFMGIAGEFVNSRTINDTITTLISVTDTLIININVTGIPAPNNENTIKVYPNPANTYIYIDYGDYQKMNGYQIKIVNSNGQQVFHTSVAQQLSYIELNGWTGKGLYFIHIIDPWGNTIETKKIILK